jgi:four helix bundle protein
MGRSYKDLVVWQKSMDLVTATYRLTAKFPKDESFGLTSQARRAAVSIPSNIAEGQARLSEREFRHFLGNARGSLMELETQLQVAENLGYVAHEETTSILQSCAEVGKVLNGLLASVSKQTGSYDWQLEAGGWTVCRSPKSTNRSKVNPLTLGCHACLCA